MLPDLTHRAHLEEEMDALPSYPEFRRCLHDLDAVSRTVLAERPTFRFLNRIAAQNPAQPLRILDVACGPGGTLRRIARWAARRRIPVHLTGLDLNPRSLQVAREWDQKFPPTTPPIHYIQSNVFAHHPTPPPDIILSNHFTHHLSNPEIIRFLQWMESTARLGWLVNDLHRHPSPYRLFRLLGAIMPWHPIVVSDGLLSIRRAFTPTDWRTLTTAANLPEALITPRFPARLTVSHLKQHQ